LDMWAREDLTRVIIHQPSYHGRWATYLDRTLFPYSNPEQIETTKPIIEINLCCRVYHHLQMSEWSKKWLAMNLGCSTRTIPHFTRTHRSSTTTESYGGYCQRDYGRSSSLDCHGVQLL
jgi:hypothetical protein